MRSELKKRDEWGKAGRKEIRIAKFCITFDYLVNL
jgi:hypothetical protein